MHDSLTKVLTPLSCHHDALQGKLPRVVTDVALMRIVQIFSTRWQIKFSKGFWDTKWKQLKWHYAFVDSMLCLPQCAKTMRKSHMRNTALELSLSVEVILPGAQPLLQEAIFTDGLLCPLASLLAIATFRSCFSSLNHLPGNCTSTSVDLESPFNVFICTGLSPH